jgi:hypothetical protein
MPTRPLTRTGDLRWTLRAVIVAERFPMWQAAGAIEVFEQVGTEPKQMVFLEYGASVVRSYRGASLSRTFPIGAAA